MNNNFSLGNKKAAQVKMQSDMYNSILHNQKMLAHALKQSAARQLAAPAPAPAPAPAHRVHKKNNFNTLLSTMNEQRKK